MYREEKTHGSSNDDFHATTEIANLLLFGYSTVHYRVLDFRRGAKFVALFFDLNSQLPCWCKYQYDRTFPRLEVRLWDERAQRELENEEYHFSSLFKYSYILGFPRRFLSLQGCRHFEPFVQRDFPVLPAPHRDLHKILQATALRHKSRTSGTSSARCHQVGVNNCVCWVKRTA